MNKRGQFFLLGAVICAIAILAISASYNSVSSSSPDVKLSYLSSEMQQEISASIDYALIKNKSVSEVIENLTSIYAGLNRDKDIFVLSGFLTSPNAEYYKNGIKSTDFSLSFVGGSALVSLDSDSLNYSFNLFEGQNLNILVKKSVGGELYVSAL